MPGSCPSAEMRSCGLRPLLECHGAVLVLKRRAVEELSPRPRLGCQGASAQPLRERRGATGLADHQCTHDLLNCPFGEPGLKKALEGASVLHRPKLNRKRLPGVAGKRGPARGFRFLLGTTAHSASRSAGAEPDTGV
ncbi:hypothetical protein NDU88_011401 [Pleurodeles waltl]|uniref:Uncharacterized protein n=1 Tax=Pleurodeles waltl TaxID=8319 RepID=A0AAV7S602_PLEWA|nr:hypothetical protein NDU88_011401 [Pleurodeles waltl]